MDILFYILIPVVFIIEFADFIVYGSFTKKPDDENIIKLLESPATFASKGMVHFGMLRFVSKKWGFTSRWYVCIKGDQKRIFIFSKMNKIIDQVHNQLLYESNKQVK